MRASTSIFSIELLLCLAGCTAMSGTVQKFSVEYSAVMDRFSNEELISNILRAEEQKPLHFSELGQINGSLQEQVQLGAMIPFGRYTGSTKSADSFQPQVTIASSPTFTTSPLDTQAFTVGLLQPIDPTYFMERWRAADAAMKELLIYLFIQSIENADGKEIPIQAHAAILRNDPTEHSEFTSYIRTLLGSPYYTDFKTITVLTPIGDKFLLDPKGTDGYKTTDIIGVADEVAIHLRTLGSEDVKHRPEYRLYRRWDNQLALCYNEKESSAQAAGDTDFTKKLHAGSHPYLYIWQPPGKGGGSSGAGGQTASPTRGGGSGGGSAGGSLLAHPFVPLVGMLPETKCISPLYIDDPQDTENQRVLRINLRSVRGAIDYLGAILRPTAGNRESLGTLMAADKITTLFKLTKLARNQTAPNGIAAEYEGITYVATGDADDGTKNYTSRVIAMLSELLNALKLSSDIATTKQVQIIP